MLNTHRILPFQSPTVLMEVIIRVRNCFGNYSFSVLGFLGPAVLSVFRAICSILALEAAISTVLQHFGVRTSHLPWYLQHLGFGST